MADFASVEDVIGTWLNGQTSVRVVTETPATMPASLIQIVRIGGTDSDWGLDVAMVDISNFASNATGTGRSDARALAEQIRTLIREHLVGVRLTGFVVSKTTTVSAPAWRPYDDINVRRFGALYQLTLHRQ